MDEHQISVADGAAVPSSLPRHRHGLSRGTVRASQEVRILVATADVVAERGYAGASLRQIAARAGVSTKTFYELYADKEAAFLAAYASVDVLVERMRGAVAGATDARGVLRAGLTTYLETLAAGPSFARALVLEAFSTTDAIRSRRRAGLEAFAATMVEGLRRVRGAGGPDPAATGADRELLIGALGGVNELCVQHLGRYEAATLPDIATVALTLLERVLLTADERASPR